MFVASYGKFDAGHLGFEMKFWAIVGDANTRKSSTIRALTGVRISSPAWDLAMQSPARTLKVFVEMCATQELKRSPQAFVARVQNATAGTSTTHVMFSLRHDPRGTYPDALAYLDHFINVAGWQCIGIAVAGANKPVGPFLKYCPTTFAINSNAATNMIAQDVRTRWGIV